MVTKEGKTMKLLLPVIIVLFVVSLAGNGYLFMQYRYLQNDPQQQTRQEMQDLVAEVSQLIVLPEGEDPTIATVADTEKLKDQAFFVQAAMGDKVLLYTTAKKAILYRPSDRKIIEVAPINLGAATTTEQQPVVEETVPAEETTE